MKKTLVTLGLFLTVSMQSANAFVSGYVGLTAGAVNGKISSNTDASESATGSTFGAVTGLELNLIIAKLGVEAFIDKSIAFDAGGYKNPLFYGGKGKLMFNLIIAEPYIALGLGNEQAKGDDGYSYNNQFGIIGLGIQAKLFNVGAFIEMNYLESLKAKDSIKTKRTGIQAGLKYYFI